MSSGTLHHHGTMLETQLLLRDGGQLLFVNHLKTMSENREPMTLNWRNN
jgi:hypothetical protein